VVTARRRDKTIFPQTQWASSGPLTHVFLTPLNRDDAMAMTHAEHGHLMARALMEGEPDIVDLFRETSNALNRAVSEIERLRSDADLHRETSNALREALAEIERLRSEAADLQHIKFDASLSKLPPASIAGATDWFMKFVERDLQRQLAALGKDGGSGRSARRGSALRGTKVAAKYRGPGGATWAGRGAMPRWMAAAIKEGKKREDFLIDKPAPATTAKRGFAKRGRPRKKK
jgi:DNA-binding protein H-NS